MRNEPSAFRSISFSRISVGVLRLAVGRQAHQLVLARVDREAAEVGEGRVEQAQRVRKAQLVRERDAVAAADAEAGRGPFADAVEREDGRLVERRGKERAGGVRLVVLGEDAALGDSCRSSPRCDLARQVQLLLAARAAWPAETSGSPPGAKAR